MIHFGSHYTNRVIFGGRYVDQHSYTEESMAFFKSMGLDVNIASKVQFANSFKLSMSEDLKKYQNQTNVVNTKVETHKAYMIGGEPPVNGSWIDW